MTKCKCACHYTMDEVIICADCPCRNVTEEQWKTIDRIFVSDLPLWKRFLIWLFPRMYDIRLYLPEEDISN